MRRLVLTILLAGVVLAAQTRIDLRSQTKSVDFTQKSPTRPVQTGTELPGTCSVGDMFFKTDAAPGRNLYACTSANVWTLQSGISGVDIMSNGAVVGAVSSIDVRSTDNTVILTPTAAGSALTLEAKTGAAIPTRSDVQSGALTLLTCSGGTNTAFICDVPAEPVMTLKAGMLFTWIPNYDGIVGPATVKIGAAAAVALKKADGTDPAAVDIRQGEPTMLYYDGMVARIVAGTAASGTFQAIINDLKASYTGKMLTIAPGQCWGSDKPQAAVTIAAGSGDGSYVAYCTDTQNLVFEHASSAGLTVTCTNCTAQAVMTPQSPEGMFPIASGTIVAGAFATIKDLRQIVPNHRHVSGLGMNTQCSAGTCIDQVDPAITQLKSENYTPLAQFDASGATMTRPVRTGTTVPVSCADGEFFYKRDGADGARLYECRGGAFTVLSAAPTSSVQLKTETYTPAAGFDASGAAETKPVRIGTVVPVSCAVGEFFYKADGADGQRLYECTGGAFVAFSAAIPASVQLKSGSYAPTADFDASAAATTKPMKAGTEIPPGCESGQFFYKSDAPSGSRVYECNGGTFALFYAGTSSSTVATDVQLKTDIYQPTAGFDASSAAETKPMRSGTNVPASCTAGDFFYKTDAAPGSRMYECVAGTFTVFSGAMPAGVQMTSADYTPTAAFDASGAIMTHPDRELATESPTCTKGETYWNTTTLKTRRCTAPNTWADDNSGGESAAKDGVYLRIGSTNYLMPGMYSAQLPSTSGFSWLANQGTASAVADSTTGKALVVTATSGTSGFRVFGKSLGSVQKVTIAFACNAASDGSAADCGFGFRQSSTGKLLTWRVNANAPPAALVNYLVVSQYVSPATFAQNVMTSGSYVGFSLIYLQIEVRNGTMYFRSSPDGTNWWTRYSEAVGPFVTPDQWWFGVTTNSLESRMIVYSIVEE